MTEYLKTGETAGQREEIVSSAMLEQEEQQWPETARTFKVSDVLGGAGEVRVIRARNGWIIETYRKPFMPPERAIGTGYSDVAHAVITGMDAVLADESKERAR